MRLNRATIRIALLCGFLGCGAVLCGASALATDTEESAATPLTDMGPTSEGMNWLMDKLKQKERSLDHREATLAAREADLKLAEKKLEERVTELQALREEMRTQLSSLDEAQEARVTGLVRMFEGMRSKDAAAILAETETEISIKVLERMSRMKAGKVLAEMEPEEAAALANLFASTPALAAAEGQAP